MRLGQLESEGFDSDDLILLLSFPFNYTSTQSLEPEEVLGLESSSLREPMELNGSLFVSKTWA
jgi:hypothetical protein